MLNNNYFHFNYINYIQTQITPIRSKMAPRYVTVTLAYLEENLYKIMGKNPIAIEKQNLIDHEKDTRMTFIFCIYPWGSFNN